MEINWGKIVDVIDEKSEETITEVSKSQYVRLADVFIIAPVLIYAGTFKQLPKWLRVALIGFGVATAVYNAKNFLANRSNLQEAEKRKLASQNDSKENKTKIDEEVS